MYQDFLDERQKYRQYRNKKQPVNRYGRPNIVRQDTSAAQKYITQQRNYNKNMQKQLDGFQLTGLLLGKSLRLIVNTVKTEVGAILLGAAALVGIVAYLKNIDSMKYSQEYSGGYGESGLSQGKTSDKGVKALLQYEGFDEVAVDREGDGVLTIGYGHKGKDVKPGQKITRQQATELFKRDLKPREDAVNRLVKVPITQNMFDALVSFVYNCGEGNFRNSDTLRLLNKKDYKGAAERMKTEYINKGTKFEKGLRARREKESAMFATDIGADGKLKQLAINGEITGVTDAGAIRRYGNGTKVGNYTLQNPVAHDGKYYIDLSERAEAYLRESGGKGIVTSGAEGNHGKGTVSHGSGNKIDVVAAKNTNEEWALTAIPFIKNKHTAYINFEDFDDNRFNAIKQIIYSKISSDLKNKCESKAKYSFDKYKRFLFNYHTGGGLHLDIGILPNAYSEQESLPVKETPKKEQPKKQPTKKPNNQTNKSKPASTNTSVKTPANQSGNKGISTGNVYGKASKQKQRVAVNKSRKH